MFYPELCSRGGKIYRLKFVNICNSFWGHSEANAFRYVYKKSIILDVKAGGNEQKLTIYEKAHWNIAT